MCHQKPAPAASQNPLCLCVIQCLLIENNCQCAKSSCFGGGFKMKSFDCNLLGTSVNGWQAVIQPILKFFGNPWTKTLENRVPSPQKQGSCSMSRGIQLLEGWCLCQVQTCEPDLYIAWLQSTNSLNERYDWMRIRPTVWHDLWTATCCRQSWKTNPDITVVKGGFFSSWLTKQNSINDNSIKCCLRSYEVVTKYMGKTLFSLYLQV